MLFARPVVIMLACAFLLSACLSGGGSPRLVEFYTLHYTSPAVEGPGTDKVVKFSRFSSARSCDGTAMLYKPAAYRIAAYTYHKWRTTPGDMVTDYLLRDFRNSCLFHAVFSYHQPEPARFIVGGGVEEFVEAKEANGWKAVLVLHVTLLDLSRSEVTERVMFQKKYRNVQPLESESPDSFAMGMSAAMARISAEVIGDVTSAVRDRERQGA